MSESLGESVTFTGTATTTPAWQRIVNRRGKESFARRIQFVNDDGTNKLQYSLDGGVTWGTVNTNSQSPVITVSGLVSFGVRSAAATAGYTVQASVA